MLTVAGWRDNKAVNYYQLKQERIKKRGGIIYRVD